MILPYFIKNQIIFLFFRNYRNYDTGSKDDFLIFFDNLTSG